MADRFDKFTERARRVLTLAQEEAQRFNHNYIGTEHILLGLTRQDDSVAARVLASLGAEAGAVRSAVESLIGRGDRAVLGEIGLTPGAKRVIELSVDEARRLHHHYIGTEHLLLGLIREGEGIAAGALNRLGVNLERARAETVRLLSVSGGEEQLVAAGPLDAPRSAGQEPPSFDRFTERARRVLTLAQEEAQRFNHNYIGTEHLLLGLVREGDGVAAKVLANLGVELNKVRSAVEFIIGRGDVAVRGEIGLTPRARTVIDLSIEEARRLNHHYIGTEHVLLGLIREGEGIAAGVLESMGVNLERVRAETARILSTDLPQGARRATAPPAAPPPRSARTPEMADLLRELEAVRREKDVAIERQEYEHAARLRDHEVRLQGAIERQEQAEDVTLRRSWTLDDFAGFRKGLALGLALTGEARAVLEAALVEVQRLGHARIKPEHLILALLLPEGPLVRELERQGVDVEGVRAAMRAQLDDRPPGG